MTAPGSEDTMLRLNAALDGELDAAGMIDVEARLAADPALAAQYARLVALRDALRTRLPRERAPDALRARVIALAQAPAPARPAPRFADPRWRALAACLLLGVALGAGGFDFFASRGQGDEIQEAIVAGFIRGRLSGQTLVASAVGSSAAATCTRRRNLTGPFSSDARRLSASAFGARFAASSSLTKAGPLSGTRR